jgi:competence protein ComEC
VLGPVTRNTPAPGSLDALLTRFAEAPARIPVRLDTVYVGDQPVRTSGLVSVYASGLDEGDTHPEGPAPGSRVSVTGLLQITGSARNPGTPDASAWAAQSGRVGWIRTNAGAIEPLPPRGVADRLAAIPLRVASSLRARASDALDADLHAPGDAVLGAMLLGERSPDGRSQALFARTGIAHLLAISGFHLAVAVGAIVGAVRLTGDRPRLEAALGLAAIAVYVCLVPVRTPIVRAALLTGAVLVAHLLARRWDRVALLGWIASALILWRPLDLFTIGFQLTFGVTALLMVLLGGRHPWVAGPGPLIGEPRDESVAGLVRRWARSLAVTSVLVWIATAPVIAFHTGSVNPLTPLAVIAATPIASVLQIAGLAALVVLPMSEAVGGLLLELARLLGDALAAVAAFFDRLPGQTVLPPLSVAWTACATGVALVAIARARRRDPAVWAGVCVVLGWLAAEAGLGSRLPSGVAARVDALRVGDGSCLLVRAGRDAVLWDAGSLRPAMGVREIPAALRALGAPRVRTAIVTHANIDHYGALPDAAAAIGLERVLVSSPALASMRASAPGSGGEVFLSAMDRLGVEVAPLAEGDAVPLGAHALEILWPPADPPPAIRARNDRSLVARLRVGTDGGVRTALLTGDIQRGAMLMLLDRSAGDPSRSLDADILEMPHHGSHHAVAERFVAEVSPLAVLQSTGPSRLGDERWDRARAAVDAAGGAWLVTARDGAISAEIRRTGEIRAGPAE